MASDSPGDTSVSVNLPESLSRWLDDKASQEGRSREDVLLQLLSAYRKVEGLEGGAVDPPLEAGANDAEGVPAALEEELETIVDERLDERLEDDMGETGDAVDAEELDRRLEEVESRFETLLTDVRERVVQVKRETDAKAPADHDHPDLAETVEELSGTADDVEAVASALDRLDTRMETGFDNYEEVLQYLADTLDTVANRQVTLAKALLETREELRKLAARDSARSAVEDLKREAGQQGVRSADCEECGSAVDVGLLTRAECPHCSSSFVGVEPARNFFGADTLATGSRPALEAGDPEGGGFEHGVGDIIEADAGETGAEVRDDIEDVAASDDDEAAGEDVPAEADG